MNIVLDTNVIVSGLLSPFGPCSKIIRMLSSNELTAIYDSRIISEYREVLKRPKFKFDPNRTDAFLDQIIHSGNVVATSPLSRSLPDPDDEPFLEAAFAGNAECLITGNLNHFPPKSCLGVNIMSPDSFLKFYKKQKQK